MIALLGATLERGGEIQGVSWRRKQYYGGSAAQSTLFPALDAALEVSHSKHSSNAFLLEMRDYMPPGLCTLRVPEEHHVVESRTPENILEGVLPAYSFLINQHSTWKLFCIIP